MMTALVRLGIWDVKDKAEVFGPEDGLPPQQARAVVVHMPRNLRERFYRMLATVQTLEQIQMGRLEVAL